MSWHVRLATGLGIGCLPWAPGTFGSLPGLLLVWLLASVGGPAAVAVGLAITIALGWATAGAAARQLGKSDPPSVVIDEIAGQMLALTAFSVTPGRLVLGFLLFRLFDITKPFPARRLEALPGASGIMADDLIAGLYANLALRLLGRALGESWMAG